MTTTRILGITLSPSGSGYARWAGAFGSEPYVAALVKLTTKRNGELKKRIETLQPTDPRCKNYLPIE